VQVKKDMQMHRRRQEELKMKVARKEKEGEQMCSKDFFQRCLNLFCLKANQNSDLTEKDMNEINALVESGIPNAT